MTMADVSDAWRLGYTVIFTTKKLTAPIMTHRSTASSSGRTPTLLTVESYRLAPMKNSVTTSSFLAT